MVTSQIGLIGRCGLYCGACIIYGVSHRTEEVFGQRLSKMAERFGCRTDQVACEGCQQLTDTCWGTDCELLKCLNARGHRYCDECAEIDDCDKFAELDGRYGGLKDSMARLRESGTEGWLAEKRDEMNCPGCGGVVYYGDGGICLICSQR